MEDSCATGGCMKPLLIVVEESASDCLPGRALINSAADLDAFFQGPNTKCKDPGTEQPREHNA